MWIWEDLKRYRFIAWPFGTAERWDLMEDKHNGRRYLYTYMTSTKYLAHVCSNNSSDQIKDTPNCFHGNCNIRYAYLLILCFNKWNKRRNPDLCIFLQMTLNLFEMSTNIFQNVWSHDYHVMVARSIFSSHILAI